MTKKKSLKSSLVKSVLSVALCAGMLVGSTYAWFSDRAKTGQTTITAGNLQVDIVDSSDQSLTNPEKSVFGEELDSFKWEPGAMWASDVFKVKNDGTLALEYALNYGIAETGGEEPDLSEVIQIKVVDVTKAETSLPEDVKKPFETPETATYQDRKALWDAITDDVEATSGVILPSGEAPAEGVTKPEGAYTGETSELVAILYWVPTESVSADTTMNPDNKYNVDKDGEPLTATFSLEVFATQTPYENDTFGPDYDKAATEQELKDALADPEKPNIALSNDIELKDGDTLTVPAGKHINGAGHTITGTPSNNDSALVVQGKDSETTVIENLTVVNENKTGLNAAIKVAGAGSVELDNVHANGGTHYGMVVSKGVDVTVNGGTFEGFSAVDIYADGKHKVVLNNVQLTGNNPGGTAYNNYGVINLYDVANVEIQVVSMQNCTVTANKAENGGEAQEYHILLNDRYPADGVKATEASATLFGVQSEESLADNNTFNGTQWTDNDGKPKVAFLIED